MKNYAQELLLLTTSLSQIKDKERVIQFMVESLSDIFSEYSFEWQTEEKKDSGDTIEVCTRNKTYGYIRFTTDSVENHTIRDLIYNSGQMLAIIVEKLEQEKLLIEQKNNLEIIVEEKTKHLIKSRDEIRSITENSPDIILRFDKGCRHLFANTQVHDLTGRGAEAFIGKTHKELGFPEEMCNFWEEKIGEVFQNGTILETDFDFSSNNKIISFNWRLIPEYGSNGEIVSVLSISRDITERKRAEESLRESEEKYRTLVEQTTDGIFLIDSKGDYIDVNSGVCQMLGYSREEILSMNIKQLVSSEDLEKQSESFERMLKGENVLNQRRLKCKNGTYIETELNARMLPDGRFCAFVRDISERKKAEAEHLRLQNLESLGVLAGGIAHDFNNILAVILGRASIAQVHASDKRVKSDLESIEKASKRAVGLTQQLLTFAKGGTPEKCNIEIRKIIQDTTRFSLSGSNVTAVFNFDDSLSLDADPGQISQVIQNLVINAKQAMLEGGIIIISTINFIDDKERQFIKIVIKDRGTGISKENLNKIFDPYFTTKDTGTGLGLSVCHSIIKRHEGYLAVESEINVGSTFTILLPATKNEIQAGDKTNTIIDTKLNILIMDDEETIRELLSSLLIESGHQVSATKEGEEAIRMYKQAKDDGTPYDIVFLDLTIKGGMGGKETVKKIREYDPEAKVAVSSGYANTSVSSYQEDGFDGMLKKPYTIEELNQVIFEVMKK